MANWINEPSRHRRPDRGGGGGHDDQRGDRQEPHRSECCEGPARGRQQQERVTPAPRPGGGQQEKARETLEIFAPLAELKQHIKTERSDEPRPFTTLEEAEREHIRQALEEAQWLVGGPTGAAAKLGMKRTTLQSKMVKLGIARPPVR